ncbi:MAG: single-stranded-DNA-specific exonuclease RecJ [Saprospiraceae bacterium]|nr:single-stranded-DNA-specific exonuclease RecJ [Saprospiraceae bacterium]
MITKTKSMSLEKEWRLIETDQVVVAQLQQALGIHPIFCQLLVQRGITTYEQAKRFFRPELSQLHNPFLMKDMDKAISRIEEAMLQKERILLYGDYDVDGTTAIALLYSFLQMHHKNLDYYIPDRDKEGYGVSFEGIEYARQKNTGLLITLDCGITAIDQIERANQYGMDVIICDHHLPEKQLPNAIAILDPKRPNCNYPFKELSGCGVAFKLAQAYVEKHGLDWQELEDLLDLLVISIASDIVPIVDENRTLAWFGLQKLNNTKRLGLRALIAKSRREPPLTISDIVFGLGPMINAAGRLADAEQAVRLMLSAEPSVAHDYARVLDYRNQLRKEFDRRIAQEAKEILERDWRDQQKKSIVLFQPHWHKGLVGIVAARMVEDYHRPAIILTQSEGKIVGSARSIKGFDIHQALGLCKDLLISYGGHAHAAGLSLYPENIIFFQERFEAVVNTLSSEEIFTPEIPIAAEIELKDITPAFWNMLRQFAPFGPGNRNPNFVTKSVRDTGFSRLLKDNHLRIAIGQPDSNPCYGIAFGRGDDYEKIKTRRPFHVCFNLQENKWGGNARLQLVVKDFKFD